MFKHILALNTYTEPFLSMSASDQKDIIEQLLGITLLSEKAELLKDKIRVSKEDTAMENARLEGLKMSNEKIKETINSLSNKEKIWNTQKNLDVEKLKKSIAELEAVNIEQELVSHQQLEEWTKFSNELKQLQKDKSSLEITLLQSDKTVKKVGQDLDNLHDNSSCYACGQEFHDEQHTKVLENKINLLTESKNTLDDYKFQLDGLVANSITVIEKPVTHYATEAEAVKHSSEIENLIKKIEEKTKESDPYEEQINEMESKALQEISFDKINDFTKVLEHQKFLSDLLTSKDSFIRKKIIDQNLNYLNTRLTYYLDKIGLPHQVVFKNDLTVEITELGREMDFFNLSRGEMNRVILSLSWAFRDVYESLYSPINIMFIDELLDNGLDTLGVENSLAILKDMARRRKKSIWLVSHREELSNRVPNILKVIKEGGFTSYSSVVST
jgi:DNA repair exonuclease SbcCD ATPase subunit